MSDWSDESDEATRAREAVCARVDEVVVSVWSAVIDDAYVSVMVMAMVMVGPPSVMRLVVVHR